MSSYQEDDIRAITNPENIKEAVFANSPYVLRKEFQQDPLFGHQLHQIAITQCVGDIPADAGDNDLGVKMPAFEEFPGCVESLHTLMCDRECQFAPFPLQGIRKFCFPLLVAFLLAVTGAFVPRLASGQSSYSCAVYVEPDGDDRNPGSFQAPLRSLEAARDYVRGLVKSGDFGPIDVCLMRGEYVLSTTFVLTAADSGTKQAPISYRSDPPGSAVISGGQKTAS